MPADPAQPAGGGLPPGAPGPPGAAPLTDTVYSHLRAIAQHQMNDERAGHSLSATALVHEAYLRLEGRPGASTPPNPPGTPPGAFLFAAAEAMRRILIEHARARGRLKRGGGAVRISLDAIGDVADLDAAGGEAADSVFAFDEAFRRLQEHEPGAADVVRLRFYAGLSVPEAARALGVSARTVDNRWAYARAWMAREMTSIGGASDSDAAGRP